MINFKADWTQDIENETFYEIDLLQDKPVYFDTSIHPQEDLFEEDKALKESDYSTTKGSVENLDDSQDQMTYFNLSSNQFDVSDISFKKLYEEALGRNSILNKEIETLRMYMMFSTESFTLEEQYLSIQEKKDTISKDVLNHERNLFELSFEEFNAQLVAEFPNVIMNKVKIANDRRKEAIVLLRDFSSKFTQVHLEIIDKIVDAMMKDDSIDDTKKKNVVNMFYQNFKSCKEMARALIDEEIRKFIERGVKGRNKPLPEESKSILKSWFLDHFKHPYPSDKEKEDIMEQTGLTKTQVNNWFINKRVRVWRPLIKKLFPECKGFIKANKEKMYLNKCKDLDKLSTRLEKSL